MSSDTSEVVALIPTPATASPTKTPTEIHDTLSLLFREGDAIMVSHLRTGRDGMAKNAFASIDEAAKFAETLDQEDAVSNIYINLQQLKPDSKTDKRQDIGQYVRFLVDIDRRNKKVDGIRVNASEEDREALRKAAREVTHWVSGIVGAQPLLADSGNGFHLCWTLRPNVFGKAIIPNEQNKTTYKQCLLAVKQRFDSDLVEIDPSLSEPEQIIRLWGTHNRRDPQTPSRPHRQSHVLAKARGTVSLVQLELLACEYHPPANDTPVAKGDAPLLHEDFDESAWWEHYSGIFVCAEERDGWQVTSICPATYEGRDAPGHRHTGSTLTGFRFDRGQGEFHCFSDDHCDVTFGQLMRHLNQYYPPYPGKIWDWGDDDCSDFAEDVSADETIPDLLPVKPNGHDESYNKKGTACPTCGTGGIEGAFDTECRSCMLEARTAVEEGRNELLLVKDRVGNAVQVVTINAASVRPEELTWTWKNRIPDASITWFVGKPGQGKSLAAVNVAATVTTGRDWDDGAQNTMGPKRVLMYCPEDSISRVVVPRLIAAGADLRKIELLDNHSFRTYCPDGTKIKRCLAMDEDIPALLTLLGKHPEIALIVCDPITGIWGDTNVNHNKEIWPVVADLMELCEKRNLTFLGVAHTNKRGNDADAIDKIQGGSTMAGAARAAFLFSRDPDSDDKHDHVMTNVKVNYTDEWNGLKFRTVGATVVTEDKRELETVRLDWLEATEMSADDVMDKQREKKANGGVADSKLGLAMAFLTVNLQAGNDVQYKLIEQAEEKEGISRATMFRAAKEMGLTSSANKPKRWFLPYKIEEPENRMPDSEVL
jgi:putative DNA primase/helicase